MRGGDLARLAGVHGVDAWFGGHSHNLVVDTVDGIPFAIAGSHGGTIAVCDLTVDPVKHQVVERHCELRTVYADEGIDSVMAARVARWNASVGPIAATALGANEHRLTRNRGGEATLGDFVTDAMREASGADIAMQNSGGLRADLEAGTVTKGGIYEVMPFDNTVFTMQLSGAEVKLALEQALRSQRVTQVSGIHYTFDLDAPEMHRVMSITLAGGKPFDDAHLYTVAVNDFMATGGDDYAVLSGGQKRTQTDLRVRDVLEQMVTKLTREGKALDYEPAGRIEPFRGAVEQHENK
jgi:2',3'-cyclic-nucleotide 2'-phosphodiesterase/3'-nucleotidase